ncbi:MAG: 1L-myo-inositol 1-phosphate cytidylyltransferase [Sphingomonadales bacterium]|nr:1L-myo-inositol 1-phosphate cytidylyltransferase [Sphingomonadales bacterium]
MKCLVIAAGQGTRLRGLAPSKPLAELNGAPLLEHVLRRAKAGGASEFLVVTGYEAERVEAALPGLAGRVGAPVEAVRNLDWARPNGLSVLAAEPRLAGDFVLLMSDHLFDPAILAALIAGRRPDSALTLAADRDVANPLLDLDDATKLRLDPAGRIAAIGKALADFNAIDTGIFLATPALFAAIGASVESGGSGSLSEGVERLAQDGTAWGFDTDGRWWLDVDDEPAFRRAEAELPRQLAGGV